MYQYYFSNHFENPFWSVVNLPEKFSGRITDHQIILTFELSRSIIDFGLTNKKTQKMKMLITNSKVLSDEGYHLFTLANMVVVPQL